MSVTDVSIPVFRFFEEISAVPRGSGNEEGISRYLAGFAEKQGLRDVRDAVNNVVNSYATSYAFIAGRTLLIE